ncbi:hypothetical protein A33M_3923 [Rhodovulum sp. PH10]|uniref:hypothetical protein n=1 Tax=Rhodovulum sp. PH10 TaxID=1187851 RepID=UPI00027C2070|nr:hypothetical protein [Rhodovulum sp. PH10]EJW10854.1 hypothetical protein A33M_3923 [Rhodovulum sp. PH10]
MKPASAMSLALKKPGRLEIQPARADLVAAIGAEITPAAAVLSRSRLVSITFLRTRAIAFEFAGSSTSARTFEGIHNVDRLPTTALAA